MQINRYIIRLCCGEKLKAALLYGPGDFRIEEIPKHHVEGDEVLIRVKACGVCPGDLRPYLGIKSLWPPKYPLLLGHEVAGVVEEVGESVKWVNVGDRVAVDMIIRCGKCHYCLIGKDNLCERRGAFIGGFAEYTKAPERNVFKIPSSLSFEEATLAEPLACCINSIEKLDVHYGDNVVIIGAGPLGLLHLQLLKLKGANVIVSEILDERLKVAEKLGADALINPSEVDAEAKVKELTEGRGADGVVVAVGNKKAIEQGIRMAGKLARVVLFGAIWPPTEISLDPNLLHYKEIILTGVHGRTLKQFYTAVKLLSTKKVIVKPLITHVYPLESIREAFEAAARRLGLKVVVKVAED